MATLIFGDFDIRPQNDIILCIFDILPDREFVRLARTCQRLYALAQPQLPGRQLKARFSTIKVTRTYPDPDIAEVLGSRLASSHVRRLVYSTDRHGHRSRCKDPPDWHGEFREARKRLYNRMERLPFWSDRSRHVRLAKATKKTVFFTIEALITLMTFCPDLDQVKYQGSVSRLTDAFMPVIRYARIHENLSLLHCPSPWFPIRIAPSSPLPLSSPWPSRAKKAAVESAPLSPEAHLPRFTKLILSPFKSNELVHLHQLTDLLSISSLLVLIINKRHILPRLVSPNADDQTPLSNVRHITFSFCKISPVSIIQIVQQCPSLRRLTILASSRFWQREMQAYSGPTIADQHDGRQNAQQSIHDIVLESLETLTLSEDNTSDDSTKSNESNSRTTQHLQFLASHDSTAYLSILRFVEALRKMESVYYHHNINLDRHPCDQHDDQEAFRAQPVLRSSEKSWHPRYGQMWAIVLER